MLSLCGTSLAAGVADFEGPRVILWGGSWTYTQQPHYRCSCLRAAQCCHWVLLTVSRNLAYCPQAP